MNDCLHDSFIDKKIKQLEPYLNFYEYRRMEIEVNEKIKQIDEIFCKYNDIASTKDGGPIGEWFPAHKKALVKG